MNSVIIKSVKTIKSTRVLNLRIATTAYSTKTETQDTSRLNYFKQLDNETKKEKPADWDTAKPFESIPGPKSVPILGSLWNFIPGIGPLANLDALQQHQYFRKNYGDIIRISDLKVRRNMVILFNPDDIEKCFRNEGVWPEKDIIPSLEHYKRDINPEVFKGAIGLLSSHGEEWYKQRSVVNPVMMQPRSAQMYINSMDQVAQDFIKRIKHFADTNPNGEMPEDFLDEINKWALESVGIIGLNKRLGLLDDKTITPESKQFIKNVLAFLEDLNELDIKPSIWRWYSTPTYKQYIKTLDEIVGFLVPQLKKEIERVKSDKKQNKQKPVGEISILERLIEKDEKIAFSMTFDLLTAGVDTTSRIVAAALYFLARHTDKQDMLRIEMNRHLPKPDSPVTKEAINDMPYLRAVIKETTRLAPIGVGNIRETVKDLVFSGYQVPKGTDVISANLLLCLSDECFPQAKKFIPERWLRGHELSNKDINPFVFQPFGVGPRSCVGKRLAELEIEVIVAKIIRNFKLTWPHEDMKWTITLLYGVGSPLKFQATPVQS